MVRFDKDFLLTCANDFSNAKMKRGFTEHWSDLATGRRTMDVSTQTPSIKLAETLEALIDLGGFNRKDICVAVGITPSALSQYVHGTAVPSLPKLVALAEFFHVPLDYLVLQRTSEIATVTNNRTGWDEHLNRQLAQMQSQIIWHTQLMERIGQVIAQEIDEKANEVARKTQELIDFWPDDDLYVLEKYSRSTKILTLDLRYDIMEAEANTFTRGSFFSVVEQNLLRKRSYQFLLAGSLQQWRAAINAFRTLVPPNTWRYCEFRCTTAPVIAGCGFYRLDVRSLEKEQPILYERVKRGIDEDDWLGYLMSPAQELHADPKMDQENLRHAYQAFEALWKNAEVWR
jgi:transcriptional regulator with XRE-family HTH domain